MNRRIKTLATLALALCSLAAFAPSASAAPGPYWQLTAHSQQTNFEPGQPSGVQAPLYLVTAENVGGAATAGTITMTLQLPTGISPAASNSPLVADQTHNGPGAGVCSIALPTVTCTDTNSVDPGKWVRMEVPVEVDDLVDPTVLDVFATISGGGAGSATAPFSTTISDTPAPFGLLAGYEGFNASAVREEGTPATQAGSHPQQLNINLGLPTKFNPSNGIVVPDGTLKDARVDLPAGLTVDPSATPKCTLAQLSAGGNCPDNTQVGIASIPLNTGAPFPLNLYNMTPPPGYAGAFAFSAAGFPVYFLAGVRPGDYRVTSLTPDSVSVLAIAGARVQLWGSPSDESHDAARGECKEAGFIVVIHPVDMKCPVPRTGLPMLSMPTSCTESVRIDSHISVWEEPGKAHDRNTVLTDSNGNQTAAVGCNALQFDPGLKARPTTNAADSPSGLDVDLSVPLTSDLNQLSTAHLRKAVVTLPEGLVVNPAGANGLGACGSAEIGIDPATGVANGAAVTCPASSRIGAVEVDTPLVPNPLVGSAYVAKPYDNPFNSLLAIYITVDDGPTGVLVKLAGHVAADPQTGRLTATFDNNPQLPFSEFKVDFFGGAAGLLRTPETCATYSTTSSLTPWSAPQSGPPATPDDEYAITQGPGGSCASQQSELPNSPGFDAGTTSAVAAANAPFVLHLRRDDASQGFSALNVSPPPGLVAKLAGTEQCSEAALAAAAQKSGHQEQQDPSCPASSEVGQIIAGAGAGPAPYYVPGKAYLAGPYKGAPLSFAFVVPAIGGPFDLGTVVTRAAVYLDPSTGRVNTVSDPLPRILAGIPLDVRSVDVSLDRSEFTRNGTSCDPMSVDGSLTSTLGQIAPLSARFQLGECGRLAFRPKLAIHLVGGTKRGSHPALRGVLRMPQGGANVAGASVALPHSEFLDQAHIGTVCTRVQFAEGAGNGASCPAASIYGHATATSPLVAYALEGNAYLRSSSHELPDLVVAMHGPPSQPVAVNVVGRVDSVKGGIRTSFEGVPDLPVSSFVLSMAGARRGLLQNSTDICAGDHRATVDFEAQNSATTELTPALRNSKCAKHKKKHHHHRSAAR